jgi:hypothetical protein
MSGIPALRDLRCARYSTQPRNLGGGTPWLSFEERNRRQEGGGMEGVMGVGGEVIIKSRIDMEPHKEC